MLEENEWVLIHSMTYQMMTSKGVQDLRRMVIQQLRFLIQFDIASFYLLADDGAKGIRPVDVVSEGIDQQELIHYLQEDIADDYAPGLFFTGKSIVYRESDILSEEERVKTKLYQRVYRQRRMHYSITAYLFYKKKFIGMLTLFRKQGAVNFDYREIYILDTLKDPLAFQLGQKMQLKNEHQLSFSQKAEHYQLSPKETEVVQVLLTDAELPEIAESLCISINTLRKHIRHIYAKTGSKNRIQLLHIFRDI